MNHIQNTEVRAAPGRMYIPRSRGAVSGLLLLLLGAWGATAPFIGPMIGFGYDESRGWTIARGWLEVLPGALTIAGGLLLLVTRNRATAVLGGWLAVVAGVWFIVGRTAAGPLGLESIGGPTAATGAENMWIELAYFHGLGALVVFLAAAALGRVSVRTARELSPARNTAAVAPIETDETPTEVYATRTSSLRKRRWFNRFRGDHAVASS